MSAEPIPVLTLWQPHAQLCVLINPATGLPFKTIETRSWAAPEKLIGERIALHAAATTKGFDELPGDCEGKEEGGWRYGYIGEFQAGHCYRSSDEGTRGDTYLHRHEVDVNPGPCPLGVIVATTTLADVVPILAEGQDPSPGVDRWVRHVAPTRSGDLWLWKGPSSEPNPSTGRPTWVYDDITDQLPYGDFTPGRFAWILADVEPVDPPVPFKGGQRLTRKWAP